ncbi:Na+/H+ antiporter NhaA [Kineosporiaceae bacterium SCSIO 59966]|nr:Na+/H+ antiporter NhaA [Kineosporiaceae bacterium SCSIO 59966]
MTSQRPHPRLSSLARFVETENTGAVLLLVATVLALLWANSPWAEVYERLWGTRLGTHLGGGHFDLELRDWVNEGLMAVFFFVAGLEIRRELDMGEFRERRRAAAPVLAALGGMVVPALLYLLVNAGEPTARGWAIVIATDTAFALGVLSLSRGATPQARTFLLTLVVADDAAALTVIAVLFTEDLSLAWLAAAAALLAVVLALRRLDVRHGAPYLLAGVGVWLATLASGVHGTIAGVALGLVATAYPPRREGLRRAAVVWQAFRVNPRASSARRAGRSMTAAVSPNERYQHLFHPWASYVVVPLFALANAGVAVDGDMLLGAVGSSITLGIVVGLVAGKLVGIVSASWLTSRSWLGGIPLSLTWPQLAGLATVAGIGFTVSLLLADIAFAGPELAEAKIGILTASATAAGLGWTFLRVADRLPPRWHRVGADSRVAPVVDLTEPVDPDVDHVLGRPEAPVVLVWYGDLQCPHCVPARDVVRQLRRAFGDDVAVVFRHLPLTDIHPQAFLAAEAAEAAAAQGRFWPFLDALYDDPGALDAPGLMRSAAAVGADLDWFSADLEERRHALRVERDVASADDSGAAGTPTFFVNGRRYAGSLDVQALSAVVQQALTGPARKEQV